MGIWDNPFFLFRKWEPRFSTTASRPLLSVVKIGVNRDAALQELQRRARADPSLAPRIVAGLADAVICVEDDGNRVEFNHDVVRAIGDLAPLEKSAVPKLVDLLHARPTYSPEPGWSEASLSSAKEAVERGLRMLKHEVRETLKKIGTAEAIAALKADDTSFTRRFCEVPRLAKHLRPHPLQAGDDLLVPKILRHLTWPGARPHTNGVAAVRRPRE